MRIVIINTNCSNLFSVKILLKKLGYNPIISDNSEIISQSDKLFLPGVGTAAAAMYHLKKKNLIPLIQHCTQPILGICLGMQLFGSISAEGQNTQTLKIIDVPVKRIQNQILPIPHMGWNKIIILHEHSLFWGIKKNHYFYFSHSYSMELCSKTIAMTKYEQTFSSVIKYKNFIGVQFHPEKSSTPGQQLIKNFLEI